MMQEKDYDVCIVGGGIVGCAVLFELTRQGYKCLLLERHGALLSEASSGNSGMLHTGFDAPANSLELKCIRVCQDNIFPLLDKFSVPYKKCGTCLVAWTPQERESIPQLQLRCEVAGITDAVVLSPSDLRRKETFLRPTAKGALFVPGESVVDSNLLGLSYAHHAKKQGAQIVANCEVEGFQNGVLHTNMGPFTTNVTINCGGLYGDSLDRLVGIKTFNILPRKGHYAVFSKDARSLLNSVIFPIPSEKTKGVGLFKSVYGNVIIGPTAEDVQERSRPHFDLETHEKLLKSATHLIPELKHFDCVGHYTGVRPATEYKDFQIASYPSRHWITAGGIRSTGVSASLGIAQLVADKLSCDMNCEPRRGSSTHLESQQWTFNKNGHSVIINGDEYITTHPICHFGEDNFSSKL